MSSCGRLLLSFGLLGSHNSDCSLVCACFSLILDSKNHLGKECFASFYSELIANHFQSFGQCFTSFPNFVSKSVKFQKVNMLSSKCQMINHIDYSKGRFLELYTILSPHGLKGIFTCSSLAHWSWEAFEKFDFLSIFLSVKFRVCIYELHLWLFLNFHFLFPCRT